MKIIAPILIIIALLLQLSSPSTPAPSLPSGCAKTYINAAGEDTGECY